MELTCNVLFLNYINFIYIVKFQLTFMREHNSANITKSNINGDASNESSQVLWITSVLCPPIIISLVYSSIARLLSPIK